MEFVPKQMHTNSVRTMIFGYAGLTATSFEVYQLLPLLPLHSHLPTLLNRHFSFTSQGSLSSLPFPAFAPLGPTKSAQ